MDMSDVEASVYCATWRHYYKGWRKVLSRIYIPYPVISIKLRSLFLFRKHLKQEKERIFYRVGEKTICSFENYAFLEKQKTATGKEIK